MKQAYPMSDVASYNDLENAVLNAVAAIHCLSTERNNLRHRLEANESQIGSLRDANEHLRRQIVLIGDSYRDYAASCANSLQGVAVVMHAAEHNAKAGASDAASGGVEGSACLSGADLNVRVGLGSIPLSSRR